MCMNAGGCRGHSLLVSLKLESQVAGNCSEWVLEIVVGPFARTVKALKPQPTLQPILCFESHFVVQVGRELTATQVDFLVYGGSIAFAS